MSQKEDEKRIAINQIKELLSVLCPEKNMKFVFNLPGGCESAEHLKSKIKIEITEFF
ncbi:hypothetical protein KAR91_53835 [Candidatus Pacearchaeota archaeon]|nr:hypothetical protein [Candidatus Pacearchaeota archaeon]